MCGLVGIAGSLELKDEITMKRLLVLDVFRGPDSTGLAAVRDNGEIKIAKISSHPLDLFDMGAFKTALSGTLSKAFIGHNRAATRGRINHSNTHPFEFDHIVGAHNGTLEDSSTRALEDALGETFSVDSQALIAGIAKLGIKDTISLCREGADSSDGAWALVWYDSMEGSLNFLRNKHRPLWYAFTNDFKRLLWASEWPMIEAAARLGLGYDLYMEKETGHRFWQIDENIHYRFDVNILKEGGDKRPKPVVKEIKGRPSIPKVSTVSNLSRDTGGKGGDPFLRHSGIVDIGSVKTKSTIGKESGSVPRIVHLIGDLHSPLGGYISRSRFEELSRYGCSWCQRDIEFEEKGVLIFERDEIIICPDCVEGEEKADHTHNSRIYTKHELYL